MKVERKIGSNWRPDKLVVGLSLLGLLLSSLPLFSDSAYQFLFGHRSFNNSSPVIGEISYVSNDIRHKNSGSMAWERAKSKQNVQLGDSVFTGDQSQSQVLLRGGQEMNLAANSMVTFTKIDDVEVPNLNMGNFLVSVKGKMKIGVGGELVEIEGNNSKVQIVLNKQKQATVKLVQGTAQVVKKGKTTNLVQHQAVTLAKPVLAVVPPVPTPVTSPVVASVPAQVPAPAEPEPVKPVARVDQFYDYYRSQGKQYKRRVPKKDYPGSQPLMVQAPELNFKMKNYVIREQAVFIEASIGMDRGVTAVSLEISEFENFPADSTDVEWVTGGKFFQRVSDAKVLYFRARGVNAAYEVTDLSPTSRIVVEKRKPAPAPILAETNKIEKKPTKTEIKPPQKVAEEKPVKRQPAATDSSLTKKIDEFDGSFFNAKYNKSTVSFEGAASTMISKEQVDSKKDNPTSLLAAVHWMGWGEKYGGEAFAKTKVADVASAGDAKASPFQIEARLHRRWHLGFSPFSKLGESQISIFGGYEYYRNGVSGPFSPKYSLIKTGMSLQFPLLKRFSTGGEFVYGFSPDKNTKYEMAGHVNYFMKKDWSIGIGYRVHIFEAGVAASSPLGLPYREAFGEGYSVIKWHY